MTEREFMKRLESVQRQLYQMAFVYFGSESLAKDVLDETIYKALKGYKKLRREEFFNTWITRILINECHREWRYQKRKKPIDEIDPEQEAAVEVYDSLPLKEAIRKLPKELKDVIVFRFLEGWSIEETAQILELPPGTVSTRQRKALKLLRKDLEEEDGEWIVKKNGTI